MEKIVYNIELTGIDEFLKIYLNSSGECLDLSPNQFELLIKCWRYSTFNIKVCDDANIFHSDIYFKEYCRNNGLNLPDASINNHISILCKKEYLIKLHKGFYKLNPKIFFKGTITERSKLELNLVLNYR